MNRTTTRARDVLPVMTVAILLAAWWFSLNVVLASALIDLTPPKLLILASLPVLLLGRFWRLLVDSDGPLIALISGYLGWLAVAAILRASIADLRLTGAYLVFLGGACLLAYSASRAQPSRAAIALLAGILGGLVISFVGVLLERFTYPGLGASDSLAPLWSLFRPQTAPAMDSIVSVQVPPLHFSSGDPSVPRAASWFAHVNYLAFFVILAAAMSAAALIDAARAISGRWMIFAGLSLAACAVSMAWTYARAGLIGLVALIAAVTVVDVIRQRGRWSRTDVVARTLPIGVVAITLSFTLLFDEVGLRRFGSSVDAVNTTPTEGSAAVERQAARSAGLRIEMQATALDLILDDPKSLLVGPGQQAYELAIHDPMSPRHISGAAGIRDPNSLWLSLAISGGILGPLLLAGIVAWISIRLLLATRRAAARPRRVLLAGLAAWLPTWACLQFVGTYPFNTSEAIILGTLLGTSVAQSGVGTEIETQVVAGSVGTRA
jgi:hypothetical protein